MIFEIHDNVDLVLEVKKSVELKGEISMRKLVYKFLNKAVPIFLGTQRNNNAKKEGM